MIGRRVIEHRTRPAVMAVLWIALTAGLGGCTAPAPRGGTALATIDWARNRPSIAPSEGEHTAAPAPGPAKGEPAALPVEVEQAAVPVPGPMKAEVAKVAPDTETVPSTDAPEPLPEASLPVIELAALDPIDPEVQQAATSVQQAEAQGPPTVTPILPADATVRPAGDEAALVDDNFLPVACTSCGKFHASGSAGAFGSSCGPGGCIPGRTKPCYHAEHSTFIGRFASNLYHCLCCPDPCYEPTWVPEANASFFVDPARPRTQKRLRWDHAYSFWFPDRSEYFWARSFRGPGPQPRVPVTKNGKPVYGERILNYDQLYVYIEAALPRFSVFTEIPYRSTSPYLTAHHAGFADMNIGTKSLLLDCDLLQLAFQFKTYLPIGSVSEGLGNGHVSLEPSLIMALHLAPHTYLQGQIAEWIPLGGDPDYAGAILNYHLSMNHLLWQVLPDVPLIGTLEFNGWSFQDGAYTAPFLGPKSSSGDSYLSLGPGLRMSVCNFIDFGVGTAFALDSPNWGDPLIRSEVRIFY